MREHPIPQDITSYRFHIIGSMTLKQFGELALGVIIAMIFYKTNLVFPIKWFFILASVGMGAAAAFVPIEERPLDHWIITFFRIMYKPTQFFWRKMPTIPAPFLYEPSSAITNQAPELDLTPVRRDRIKQYLQSVKTPALQNAEEVDQNSRIQNILETFKTQPVTTVSTVKHVEQKPDLSVRVRKMRTDTVIPPTTSTEVTLFTAPPLEMPVPTPQTDLQMDTVPGDTLPSETTTHPQPGISEVVIPEQQAITIENAHAAAVEPLLSTPAAVAPIGDRAYIPTQQPAATPDPTMAQAAPASFNTQLPFPTTPDIPNKLVGMVLSPTAELITDAIVEIHAADGTILRAVKTNALGQFFISTPLTDGQYTLVVEKDGVAFEPQHITLTGGIVPPIEVRSI